VGRAAAMEVQQVQQAALAGPDLVREVAKVPSTPDISQDEDTLSFLAEEQQLRRVVDELEATTAQAKAVSVDRRFKFGTAVANLPDVRNFIVDDSTDNTTNTTKTWEAPDTWHLFLTFLGPLAGVIMGIGFVAGLILAPFGAFFAWLGSGLTKACVAIGNSISAAVTSAVSAVAAAGASTFSGGSPDVSVDVSAYGVQVSSFLVCWILLSTLTGMITGTRRGWAIGAMLGLISGCINILSGMDTSWIEVGVYILFWAICAKFYTTFLVYQYPPLRRPPEVTQGDWSFGLFDGLTCDPGPRICLTSLFMTPVRWADTSTALGIQAQKTQYTFWTYCFGFTILSSIATATYGVSAFLLLLWVIYNRQQIRKVYELPSWTPSTVAADCCIWTWCAPCAVMQEAMQAEFIDVPAPSFPRPSQSHSFQSPPPP